MANYTHYTADELDAASKSAWAEYDAVEEAVKACLDLVKGGGEEALGVVAGRHLAPLRPDHGALPPGTPEAPP